MTKKIIIPATLDGATRKKDGSVSVRFVSTFEMTTEDYMALDKLRNMTGWAVFSPNIEEVSDIPKEKAPEREGKSRSKVLYNVLYILYIQTHPDDDKGVHFQQWYETTMNKVINQFKDKLED